MSYLGVKKPGSTVYIEFDTFNSSGAAVTLTGLAVTDVEVYKDGSTTQRASDNGYTLQDTDGIDFDATTGIHGLTISLADNSTAGFWAAGSHYRVVINAITVDGQTVIFTAATFEIGYPDAILNTTIASLSSQTSFTLTAGPAEDDALNGCAVLVHDVASAVQMCIGYVLDYTGSSKTVTLGADPGIFTMAAADNISIFMPAAVRGWAGSPVAAPNVAGVPKVDPTHWLGTAAATPTVAGVPEVDVTHWIGTAAATPTVAGVPEVDMTHVAGSATPATNASAGFRGLVPGTCTTGSSTTAVITTLTEATDDHYNGRVITFLTGACTGQTRAITDYNGTTKTLTVGTLTDAPADGDTFVIS